MSDILNQYMDRTNPDYRQPLVHTGESIRLQLERTPQGVFRLNYYDRFSDRFRIGYDLSRFNYHALGEHLQRVRAKIKAKHLLQDELITAWLGDKKEQLAYSRYDVSFTTRTDVYSVHRNSYGEISLSRNGNYYRYSDDKKAQPIKGLEELDKMASEVRWREKNDGEWRENEIKYKDIINNHHAIDRLHRLSSMIYSLQAMLVAMVTEPHIERVRSEVSKEKYYGIPILTVFNLYGSALVTSPSGAYFNRTTYSTVPIIDISDEVTNFSIVKYLEGKALETLRRMQGYIPYTPNTNIEASHVEEKE